MIGPGTAPTSRPRSTRGARGDRGARAPSGLHDDGRCRQPGDQPVAGDEPVARRRRPRRHLAHQQAFGHDALDERQVAARVGPVDARGEDADGGAPAGECSAMGGGVDPEGRARDDRDAAVGAAHGELVRDLLAVGRAGAGARRAPRPGASRGRDGAGPRTHRQIGASAPSASSVSGHSSSPGTTRRPPTRARSARSRAGSSPSSRTRQRDTSDAEASPRRNIPSASAAPWRRDELRRHRVNRFGEPAPHGPCRPLVGRVEPCRQRRRHAATRLSWRSRRARATWSRPGAAAPSRSASVHEMRNTRS